MRILFCGVAAIALSGCSWMGFGSSNQGVYGAQSGQPTYNTASNDGCCVGSQRLSRWNLETSLGAENFISGDMVTGSETHPGFVAPGTTVDDVKAKDMYAVGYRASLGGSYALNPNRKVTAQAFYSKANGNETSWGTQGGDVLRGTVSDYKSYGVEAGLRQYMQPKGFPLLKSIRPYVEGRVGVAHVDAISMNDINQPGGATSPSTPTSLAMYDSSWVPTGSALIGVETPLFKRMTVGLETGVRYSGGLKSDNSDVAGGTFNSRYSGFNNGGSRLTVPVTIRGRYRF